MNSAVHFLLASNVKSNARNKPDNFETALARPLHLLGDWEMY